MSPLGAYYAYAQRPDLNSPAFWQAEGLPGLAQLTAQARTMRCPAPSLAGLYKQLRRLPRILRGYLISRRAL